jgi:hypothetical protein
LVVPPRLHGHERASTSAEVEIRHTAAGARAVDSYLRTPQGDGPLTNLLYEMRRLAADQQARSAAERVAARQQ